MLSDRTLSLEKMAKTEKQIWRVLDSIEINCKTMKQQVEKHTEKQVSPLGVLNGLSLSNIIKLKS